MSSQSSILSKKSSKLIRLAWDGGLLKRIQIGVHGGLDLEEEKHIARYVAHNLRGLNGLYAAMIAINYSTDLVKLRKYLCLKFNRHA